MNPVLWAIIVIFPGHIAYFSFDISRHGLQSHCDTISTQILLKEIKEEAHGTKNDGANISTCCSPEVVFPAGFHLVGCFFN